MENRKCDLQAIEMSNIPMLSGRSEVIVFVEDLIHKCLKCTDSDCTTKYDFIRHLDKPEMDKLQEIEAQRQKLLDCSFD